MPRSPRKAPPPCAISRAGRRRSEQRPSVTTTEPACRRGSRPGACTSVRPNTAALRTTAVRFTHVLANQWHLPTPLRARAPSRRSYTRRPRRRPRTHLQHVWTRAWAGGRARAGGGAGCDVCVRAAHSDRLRVIMCRRTCGGLQNDVVRYFVHRSLVTEFLSTASVAFSLSRR